MSRCVFRSPGLDVSALFSGALEATSIKARTCKRFSARGTYSNTFHFQAVGLPEMGDLSVDLAAFLQLLLSGAVFYPGAPDIRDRQVTETTRFRYDRTVSVRPRAESEFYDTRNQRLVRDPRW